MGLLLTSLAGRAGAIAVTVVEPNAARRQLSLAMGASAAVGSSDEIDGDPRFDVVIDATGAVAAIEDALGHVRRGGRYLQFGVAAAEATATFSPYRLYNDELSFVGSMAVLHSFERACDIATNLDLGLDRLVSSTLPLGSYAQALQRLRQGQGLKTQVAPGS
jgi:threonine dehydrogenase-like Zn-dependent dehydrogenase